MSKPSKITSFLIRTLVGILFTSVVACAEGPSSTNEKKPKHPENKISDTVSDASKGKEQPLSSINALQEEYAAITGKLNAETLDSIKFTYSCRNEIKGTIIFFEDQGKLALIVHRYNEYDHFSAVDNYFVKDGNMFFSFKRSLTWAFESGPEGSTRDNVEEKRTYFINEEAVKCLEKNFTIRSQSPNNPDANSTANREVDCKQSEDLIKKAFVMLKKFRAKPTSGCLE